MAFLHRADRAEVLNYDDLRVHGPESIRVDHYRRCADRLELANVQFHGWARLNQRALIPSRDQLERAAAAVRRFRATRRRPEIVYVLPDFWSRRPKPCMGGWGARTIVVTPEGTVQPCHSAGSLPGLEFWKVSEHDLADCWERAPGMNAFRGESWMSEPCSSCPERKRDFGGCRCQAYALTGSMTATDPACALSPHRDALTRARTGSDAPLIYRGDPVAPAALSPKAPGDNRP